MSEPGHGPTREITIEQALRIVQAAVNDGEFDEAESLLDAILAAAPEHPDALHYKGLSYYLQGRVEEARALFEQALALIPDHAALWNNIGNLYNQTGETGAAVTCYARAVALSPDSIYLRNNLLSALRISERYEEAETLAEALLQRSPNNIDVLNNCSNLFAEMGKTAKAADCLGRILSNDELTPRVLEMQVACFTRVGNHELAERAVRKLAEIAPLNPTVTHHMAALTGGTVPTRAADDYIQHVFDEFSASFDSTLKKLSYQAPTLVARSLATARGEPRAALDILDAGCGTGLCGPLVRPYARRLVGMDLSEGMLRHARNRKVYDALDQAELTAYMDAHEAAFDAITCADTLCYFGDLTKALAAARKALRPGGLFIYTVEQNVYDDEPYRIQTHGRYCHTEEYVRDVCREAGLSIDALDHDKLRTEGGTPVLGLIVRAVA